MDKKKVKELIGQAIIWSKQANQYSVISNLEEALQELSKSDWVSVEDGLPEYDRRVYVYSKLYERYGSAIRMNTENNHYDNNGFLAYLHVTHWKPIEKLEE